MGDEWNLTFNANWNWLIRCLIIQEISKDQRVRKNLGVKWEEDQRFRKLDHKFGVTTIWIIL